MALTCTINSASVWAILPSLTAARSESLFRETLPWLVALIVLAVVGCLILMMLRRMLQAEPEQSQPFTLDALRRLHRSGELTDEEFERAKSKMLGSAKVMAARERAKRRAEESARRQRLAREADPRSPQTPLDHGEQPDDDDR